MIILKCFLKQQDYRLRTKFILQMGTPNGWVTEFRILQNAEIL